MSWIELQSLVVVVGLVMEEVEWAVLVVVVLFVIVVAAVEV